MQKHRLQLNKELTSVVKRLMRERCWTQRYLADRMGVAESELSSLLCGRRQWTIKWVLRLNSVAGKPVEIKQ